MTFFIITGIITLIYSVYFFLFKVWSEVNSLIDGVKEQEILEFYKHDIRSYNYVEKIFHIFRNTYEKFKSNNPNENPEISALKSLFIGIKISLPVSILTTFYYLSISYLIIYIGKENFIIDNSSDNQLFLYGLAFIMGLIISSYVSFWKYRFVFRLKVKNLFIHFKKIKNIKF